MKKVSLSILSLAFLLLSSNAYAQIPPPGLVLKWDNSFITYEGHNAETASEQTSRYIPKYYVNGEALTIPTECTGTAKPFICKAAVPPLKIGNNILYVAITDTTIPNLESEKSTPLVIFYAINQKEIISNTERQSVTRCQPGSYQVQRITDATKLLGIVNGITTFIPNIVATTNAIYIFSCSLFVEVK